MQGVRSYSVCGPNDPPAGSDSTDDSCPPGYETYCVSGYVCKVVNQVPTCISVYELEASKAKPSCKDRKCSKGSTCVQKGNNQPVCK